MEIKDCKYSRTPTSKKNECVIATIDGVKYFVPIDISNKTYEEILKRVDAGTLTIAKAD